MARRLDPPLLPPFKKNTPQLNLTPNYQTKYFADEEKIDKLENVLNSIIPESWSIEHVAQWLLLINLEKYIKTFRGKLSVILFM